MSGLKDIQLYWSRDMTKVSKDANDVGKLNLLGGETLNHAMQLRFYPPVEDEVFGVIYCSIALQR